MCRRRCGPRVRPVRIHSRDWRQPMFRTSLLLAAALGAAALAGAGALAGATIAFAHITLENQQAPVGASYKAVLRVPHGCDGSATVAVRVRIPDGFIEVEAMPK